MSYKEFDFIIVGSGLFGATVAHQLANKGKKVLIIEKRDHIGGNCYTYKDSETGIDVHKYGSHIFHTKNERVWDFVNKFTEFNRYTHKVITMHDGVDYPFPINLETINKFFKKRFMPDSARRFISDNIGNNHSQFANLESKAISQVGEELYSAFVKEYTLKQWNRSPSNLPASIINRIPVRFNHNAQYFDDPYQGMPVNGYTPMIWNMVSHENITIQFETDYFEICDEISMDQPLIYTGPIDKYFDYEFGELNWRSLGFKIEHRNQVDYQGTSVVNYADVNIPYTRTHEFKHYHPENKELMEMDKTVVMHELPVDWSRDKEAYYPVRMKEDVAIFESYKNLAKGLEHVYFGGRLGMYAYIDMDAAINLGLQLSDKLITRYCK